MKISHVKIFSDGGARGNPGPAAFAYVICDERNETLQEHAETLGQTTNNVAEYNGVIHALTAAAKLGVKTIDFYTDSELVQRQLTGVYRIKTPHILELYKKVRALEPQFQSVKFNHVPRTHEKIQEADRLVNRALDGEF